MPRTARVVLPNAPHHIVQRGHNRQVVFVSDEDYQYYLENLREWKDRFGCKLYGYCLMTNHVHLIVDPGDDADNLGRLMKRLAGKQTRYVNKLEKRTGSLWEGRYKSHPIETNEYLMVCCRYVDLNPIRATMVDTPEDYRWSSYSEKIGLKENGWLDKDVIYQDLATTEAGRQVCYQALVELGINREELKTIRESLQFGRPYGSNKFQEEIEKKLSVRLPSKKRGRPCKQNSEHVMV